MSFASDPHQPSPDSSALREYPADAGGPPRRSWYELSRADLQAILILVLLLALAGLLIGFIWEQAAPRLYFTVVRQGGSLVGLQDFPESEAKIAADSWFGLLTAGWGIVSAALLWTRRSLRGPVLLIALALASLLGAVIAWRFGLWLGRHPTHAEADQLLQKPGNHLHKPLDLQAKGTLFFQPIAAVLVTLICLAFTTSNDLGRSEADTR